MTSYLIKQTGEVSKIDGIDFAGIQNAVGGYVQIVNVPRGGSQVVLCCNEDGKPLGFLTNALATSLWWHLNPSIAKSDNLCGDVVVTGEWGDDDTIAGAPDDVAQLLAAWIK